MSKKLKTAKIGDNSKIKATELEGLILRTGASDHALHDALRNCDTNQKELQMRAYAARWYSQDYMADVASGKLNPTTIGGLVSIPAMTDAIRKVYLTKLSEKTKDKVILQKRSTLRTWWTRLLFAAGVKTMEARGGARVKKGKAKVAAGATAPGANPVAPNAGAKPSVAPVIAATPRVTSQAEAMTWFQTEAKLMLRFAEANKTAMGKGKPSPVEPFTALVSKFYEDLCKLKLAK